MRSGKSTKRVLLVGTSYSAAPLLMALKESGLHVAVCGSKPNDPCVPLADAYFEVDYSDPIALTALIKREGFTYVCPSCNDSAYMSAAYAAERLGLPGFDDLQTAQILHNKALFRKFAIANKIPSPKVYLAGQGTPPSMAPAMPAIVKPVDSFSGRGMAKAARLRDLPKLIEAARAESRTSEAIVEEFIDGSLHSHSAFIRGGKIVEDYFVDEFCKVYSYQVDCSNYPSRLSKKLRLEVRATMARTVKLLKLTDGLLHTQFIVHGADFSIIECMRRCPGDLYFHLVEFATGARYIRNYVAPFIGRPVETSRTRKLGYWARHTISFAQDTVFWSCDIKIAAREVRTYPLCESAQIVRRAPFGKAAIVFARFATQTTMLQTTPVIRNHISIEATPAHHG